MTFTKKSLITLAVLAGCAATVSACSSSPDASSPGSESAKGGKGRVDLSLTVGGTTLTSIGMAIFTGPTATGTPIISKTINLSSPSATISAFVGSLNVGPYTVQFTGANSCSGTDTFNIVAGATITKLVTINCGTATVAPARGSARIDGQIVNASDCPYLTNTFAAPLTTDVGSSVDLSTVPAGTGAAAATVTWAEAGGTFTASGTTASYPCTTAGTHHLEVTLKGAVGSPQASCTEVLTTTSAGNPSGLDIVCVGPSGTGGAPGTGGAGTGGAGTGGAGTGGAGTGGAGTGGAGTGGAGTGGAGTGGAGTGGAPTSQFCTNPGQAQLASTTDCHGCESDNCDPPYFAGCGASPDAAACNAILACYRTSHCINNGITTCFCGDATVDACAVSGPVNAACSTVITAGFPTGTPPATILNSFGAADSAGGWATGIGLCENNFCAASCIPFCGP